MEESSTEQTRFPCVVFARVKALGFKTVAGAPIPVWAQFDNPLTPLRACAALPDNEYDETDIVRLQRLVTHEWNTVTIKGESPAVRAEWINAEATVVLWSDRFSGDHKVTSGLEGLPAWDPWSTVRLVLSDESTVACATVCGLHDGKCVLVDLGALPTSADHVRALRVFYSGIISTGFFDMAVCAAGIPSIKELEHIAKHSASTPHSSSSSFKFPTSTPPAPPPKLLEVARRFVSGVQEVCKLVGKGVLNPDGDTAETVRAALTSGITHRVARESRGKQPVRLPQVWRPVERMDTSVFGDVYVGRYRLPSGVSLALGCGLSCVQALSRGHREKINTLAVVGVKLSNVLAACLTQPANATTNTVVLTRTTDLVCERGTQFCLGLEGATPGALRDEYVTFAKLSAHPWALSDRDDVVYTTTVAEVSVASDIPLPVEARGKHGCIPMHSPSSVTLARVRSCLTPVCRVCCFGNQTESVIGDDGKMFTVEDSDSDVVCDMRVGSRALRLVNTLFTFSRDIVVTTQRVGTSPLVYAHDAWSKVLTHVEPGRFECARLVFIVGLHPLNSPGGAPVREYLASLRAARMRRPIWWDMGTHMVPSDHPALKRLIPKADKKRHAPPPPSSISVLPNQRTDIATVGETVIQYVDISSLVGFHAVECGDGVASGARVLPLPLYDFMRQRTVIARTVEYRIAVLDLERWTADELRRLLQGIQDSRKLECMVPLNRRRFNLDGVILSANDAVAPFTRRGSRKYANCRDVASVAAPTKWPGLRMVASIGTEFETPRRECVPISLTEREVAVRARKAANLLKLLAVARRRTTLTLAKAGRCHCGVAIAESDSALAIRHASCHLSLDGTHRFDLLDQLLLAVTASTISGPVMERFDELVTSVSSGRVAPLVGDQPAVPVSISSELEAIDFSRTCVGESVPGEGGAPMFVRELEDEDGESVPADGQRCGSKNVDFTDAIARMIQQETEADSEDSLVGGENGCDKGACDGESSDGGGGNVTAASESESSGGSDSSEDEDENDVSSDESYEDDCKESGYDSDDVHVKSHRRKRVKRGSMCGSREGAVYDGVGHPSAVDVFSPETCIPDALRRFGTSLSPASMKRIIRGGKMRTLSDGSRTTWARPVGVGCPIVLDSLDSLERYMASECFPSTFIAVFGDEEEVRRVHQRVVAEMKRREATTCPFTVALFNEETSTWRMDRVTLEELESGVKGGSRECIQLVCDAESIEISAKVFILYMSGASPIVRDWQRLKHVTQKFDQSGCVVWLTESVRRAEEVMMTGWETEAMCQKRRTVIGTFCELCVYNAAFNARDVCSCPADSDPPS